MSELVVVAFDTEEQANQLRGKLMGMSKEYLVELEDAVVAVKKSNGKVKLQQMHYLTTGGAVAGGFWGALIGLIFLNPLLGMAMGAGAGAITGALSDVGIDDKFMKELADRFKPGSSLLFVLFRKINMEKALEELTGAGGHIIKTSLKHEDEAKLQSALTPKEK